MPSGVYFRTTENKKNLSLGQKGVKRSEKARLNLKVPRKGSGIYTRTEIHKKRISQGQKRLVEEGRHNLWKGGITPLNKIIRNSSEYKLWREAVFKRDGYKCIWCGACCGMGRTVIFNADHIKPFSLFPELRFAIDNGRTLCVPCHRGTDTWGEKAKHYKQNKI